MFHKLGVNWAGSLLGFLGLAFMPIPFLFYIYGERLRKNSAYAPTEMGKKKNDEENQDGTGEEEKSERGAGENGAESGSGSSTGVDGR